ncbi:MAG: hypothetical protein MJY77_06485 [Bacteroidaceae bacterium]|nr:hypothetical protein [Bacteroidaceae bacterium]
MSSNIDNVLDVWVPFFCKHWMMEFCLSVRDSHLSFVSPFLAVFGRRKVKTTVPSAQI